MSYGLKYQGYFTSTKYGNLAGIDYTIKLEFLGYSGAVTEITVNGFKKSPKSGSDFIIGLKEFKYEFGIVTDTLRAADFYPDSERHVKLSLYEIVESVEVLVSSGFLDESNAKEEYADGKQALIISATDGLDLLKGEKYEDANGKAWHSYPYADRGTLLLFFTRCFGQIGLGLNFNTAFNVCAVTDVPAANYDVLAFNERGQRDFSGKSCYDVLKVLVESLNCCLFQEDGEWWMVHLLGQRDSGQFYRKWDNAGAYISGGLIDDADTVASGQALSVLGGGVRTYEKPYKRVISTVELGGYVTSLLNPTFIPNGSGGYDYWTITDAGLTVSNGGVGTSDDPYYLEIEGYQTISVFNRIDIAGVWQEISLGDASTDLEEVISKQIRIKGRVLGSDVKTAFITVYLVIETTDADLWLVYTLSSEGNWNLIEGDQTLLDGVFVFANTSKKARSIEVNLIDKDGDSFDEYSSFDILSESVKEASDSKYPWLAYGVGGAGFSGVRGLSPEDFKSVKIGLALHQGAERTDTPKGASYDSFVRFADMDVQVQNTLITQRATKIKYTQETAEKANRELTVERGMIDFSDATQTVAITKGGVPTTEWVTNGDSTPRSLVEHLNREILYITHLPQVFLDGNIKGRVKMRRLLSFYGFDAPAICVAFGYDYGESIAAGVRYQKLWVTAPPVTSKKYGITEDNREVEFTLALPTEINTRVPAPHPPRANTGMTGVHNGNLVIEKGPNLSGAVNFLNSAGLVANSITPEDDGFFYLKTDDADPEAILTHLTGWKVDGSNIATEKLFLGTESGDFDIGFKRNGAEIATINSSGIGIGTTSIDSLLHLNKAAGDAILTLEQSGNGNTSGIAFVRERLAGEGTQGAALFVNSDTSTNDATFVIDVDTLVNTGSSFGSQQRFSISSAGDAFFGNLAVGIGIESPATDLHIQSTGDYTGTTPNSSSFAASIGNAASGVVGIGSYDSQPAIQGFGVGTSYNLYLNPANGNIGLGAKTLLEKVTIGNGTDAFNNYLEIQTDNTSTYTPGIKLGWGGSDYARMDLPFDTRASLGLKIGTFHGYPTTLYANSVAAIKLNTNGDVDIVNGTTKTTNLKITASAALGYVAVSNADGKVIWTDPSNLNPWAGDYDASTNTPTLANGTGTYGEWYYAEVGGTVDFGAGNVVIPQGSRVIYNGSVWSYQTQNYTLNPASASVLGGIKIGSTLDIASGVANLKSGIITPDTYRSVTVDTYGRVTGGTNPTTIAGHGITDSYTKTEVYTQAEVDDGFVDLTTAQAITGLKTLSGGAHIEGLGLTSGGATKIAFNSSFGLLIPTFYDLIYTDFNSSGQQDRGQIWFDNRYSNWYTRLDHNGLKIGVTDATATEALDITGNIKYSGLLKPSGTAGANKQVLSTNATNDAWVSLDGSYISDWGDKYDAADFTTDFNNSISGITTALNAAGLSTNYYPKWDGNKFVDSEIKFNSVTSTTQVGGVNNNTSGTLTVIKTGISVINNYGAAQFNTANGNKVLAIGTLDSGHSWIQASDSYLNSAKNLYIQPTGGGVTIGSATYNGLAKLEVSGSILQTSVTSSYLKADADGVLIAADFSSDWTAEMSTFIGAAPEVLNTWLELVAEIQDTETEVSGLITSVAANASALTALTSGLTTDYHAYWDGNKLIASSLRQTSSQLYTDDELVVNASITAYGQIHVSNVGYLGHVGNLSNDADFTIQGGYYSSGMSSFRQADIYIQPNNGKVIIGTKGDLSGTLEKFNVDGNFRYDGLLKPSGVAGTDKQVLSTDGTNDLFVSLSGADYLSDWDDKVNYAAIIDTTGSFTRTVRGAYLCGLGDESYFSGYDETSGMPVSVMKGYNDNSATVITTEEFMHVNSDIPFRRVLVTPDGNFNTYAFLSETLTVTDITAADSITSLNGSDILFTAQNGTIKKFDLYSLSEYMQKNLSLGSGASSFGLTDITNQTAVTTGLSSTDEFVINHGNSLARIDLSVVESYMQENLDLYWTEDNDLITYAGDTRVNGYSRVDGSFTAYGSSSIKNHLEVTGTLTIQTGLLKLYGEGYIETSSPNGTKYNITVNDAGSVIATVV